ncbi:glycosyl hydrolase family 5 [uncultured Fibrobacter sp.]|uniref:glycosyl hydrolase family 5 n=1 Tax=uncultured Fibrobacter sp. TaxID=261512 RepID=UPI00260076DC|nr:glycosyl hydrolase family 5 [uncultured Fibrobacter sp.]
MKRKLFKTVIAAGAVAMICACGDDAATKAADAIGGVGSSGSASPAVDSPCNGVLSAADTWLFDTGNGYWVIYADGAVTDAAGKPVAAFVDGSIMTLDGVPAVSGIDLNTLTPCKANAVIDTQTGELTILSSASADPQDPGLSAGNDPLNPGSSAATNPEDPFIPKSSTSVNPNDTTTTPLDESSSSVNTDPDIGPDGFPTIESYGEPPAEYTKDILNNGKTGWSSRYWDACKPHCSWLSSVDTTSEETYEAGMTVARNCNIHDVEVPAFTLGHAVQQYWMGFEGTNSACDTKDSTGTFTCSDMAPIAVNENLSYGYVAGSGSLYKYGCGKCYHLQYNGGNHANDVKATHKALKGKHIVVMVSNIGYDVEEGQFDMLVPGGGVGAFDALSTMLGVSKSDLGAGSGGFLTECQQSLGWDNTVEAYQKCVIAKCEAVFSKWPNLLRGCKWYAEWYMAADNPTYNWEEVECPQYLIDHYMTTINTTKDNRYRWRDDWSSYKKGDELETQECLTADYPQGCGP